MCALQSTRPKPEYPCSQQDLYTIVETGWGSYAQHLPDFINHSTLYTAATGADQLLAVKSARAIPDEDQRNEVHMTLRVRMLPLADACMIIWSDMSSYIRDGFPEDEYDNKRLAAGYNYYEGAGQRDWESVKGLMQDGLLFANANAADLTVGGMLPTFIADFEAAKDAFELKYQEFLQAEEESKVIADQKLRANNLLYKNLTKMFEDGKRIFREDAALREQFTFDRIWELVKGSGGGVAADTIELGVFVESDITKTPVEGAVVQVLNAPGGEVIIGKTNGEGFVRLKISGYTAKVVAQVDVEVSALDHETELLQLELETGAFYSIDIQLVAPPSPPPVLP